MSKEATIIQSFNAEKRQYEYFVKGYDVTESVEILLKRHKEAYDKEKKVFAGIGGYLEAQKEYQSQIDDLQSELAEKERQVNVYAHEIAFLDNELAEKDREQNQKAIEQLEKVKEKFGYKHNSQLVISSKNLVGFIDQQINELKEGEK